jgi:hypothetical protein
VFKHLLSRFYSSSVRFSYWRGRKNHEVDLLADTGGRLIPFEVKYRTQHTGKRELKGLIELCETKAIEHAYVVTRSLHDFGPFGDKQISSKTNSQMPAHLMRIPAPLLCYWLGASEVETGEQPVRM